MQNENSRKTPLIILLLSLLVLGGAYAGYHEYMSLRQARLLKQARRYLTRSDLSRAQLCLRSALAHNPKDLTACRLMAQVGEASHSPSALLWRGRVVEYNPHSLDDRLKLAQSASMLRDYSYAANTLEGVPPEDKKTAAYQNVAGDVAAAANQYGEAEAHFLEVIRLEPTNINAQLSLAVVRLHDTNTAALSEARATLRLLAASPAQAALHCQALRELAMDALRWKEMDTALALSQELLRQTNSVFQDQLLRLDVLQEAREAGFHPALAACQRAAAQSQTNIYELATWEMVKTSPGDALVWLRSLPAQTQTNQSVALLIAECNTKVGDWPGLLAFLQPQNWAELDFIRHGFQARALRGQNLEDSSKAQWEQALELTHDQNANLVMLLRLAVDWRWTSEAEDILWTIVNRYPSEKWALRTLAQALFAGGRTRPLMQLFSQESKRMPKDLAAKNNMAMTALLLDAQELNPQALAREVYEEQPTNSSYASTYALALYLRTNNVEALKVLEKLNPRELENPTISGCYGLVLLANGQAAKARKYLNLTSRTLLLPEERRLIEKAQTGI